MIVKLLVLITLAFSLGDVNDDVIQPSEEISLMEVEAVDASDGVIAATHDACPGPDAGMPLVYSSFTQCSRDAGRVFRPPRPIAV